MPVLQLWKIPQLISMLPPPSSAGMWWWLGRSLRGWSVSEGLMGLCALVCGDGADSIPLFLWSNTHTQLQARHVPWHEASRVTPNTQLMEFIRNLQVVSQGWGKTKLRKILLIPKGEKFRKIMLFLWLVSTLGCITTGILGQSVSYNLWLWDQVSEPVGLFLVTTWCEGQYSFYESGYQKKEAKFPIWIQGKFNNSGFERKFHPWIPLRSCVINLWGYFVVIACCFGAYTSPQPASFTFVSYISQNDCQKPPREHAWAIKWIFPVEKSRELHPLITIFLAAKHSGPIMLLPGESASIMINFSQYDSLMLVALEIISLL